ncbi:MAG: AraC family transcriptional regulator [Myxococcota bacterium]
MAVHSHPGRIMVTSSYAQRVHRVMDHVRNHLAGDLSLDALARVAHFSPYHFHRIFKAATGETLVAFTQRARLERAAYLMMSSPERPLGSIALEVGFSAQSDFSRVFRRHFGVAPSSWDRTSRLDARHVVPEFEAAVRAARGAGPAPEARLVDHPACRLAYVRMRTPFLGEALREGYERLTDWLERRGVDWRACPLIGMSWDHYETTPLDKVRFDFGFGVPDAIAAEGEFGIVELPAVRSVDVHCRGPLVHIAVAWQYLYEEWLPGSRYEPDDLPGIKRFRTRPDQFGWDRWDLDCSIAVRPAQP